MSNKNYKGGYKIVSLHGIDLITMALGVVIDGIHKVIESSYQKALLLSDIVIDGVEKNDVYITELVVSSGSYVIKAYGYEITITSDDEVTATEIEPPAPVVGGTQLYKHTITIDFDKYASSPKTITLISSLSEEKEAFTDIGVAGDISCILDDLLIVAKQLGVNLEFSESYKVTGDSEFISDVVTKL